MTVPLKPYTRMTDAVGMTMGEPFKQTGELFYEEAIPYDNQDLGGEYVGLS